MEALFILLLRDKKDEIVTVGQGSGCLWEGNDASSSGCLSLWLSNRPCKTATGLLLCLRGSSREKKELGCAGWALTPSSPFPVETLENGDQEDWELYYKKPKSKQCVACTSL